MPQFSRTKNFATTLIAWQKKEGRHDLPWQNTCDPYRIWLSEIMLQQTQVATVKTYYVKFLEHFPTVQSLAQATQDQVLGLWSGLGYYSRARNLHRCAQIIMQDFNGQFPQDRQTLQTMPGIGRSTAAAISAFAWGKAEPILDGNVKRVFTRVFGVEGFPGERKIELQLWDLAQTLMPAQDVDAYTQGLMDFGSTLCTRGQPACQKRPQACPFSNTCVAYQNNRTHELPYPRPRKAMPERSTTMLLLSSEGHILLEKRPEKGIWGGLWSLPEWQLARDSVSLSVSEKIDKEQAAQRPSTSALRAYIQDLGKTEKAAWFPQVIDHTFTHFKLHIHVWQAELSQSKTASLSEEATQVWWPIDEVAQLGLPAPIRKIIGDLM